MVTSTSWYRCTLSFRALLADMSLQDGLRNWRVVSGGCEIWTVLVVHCIWARYLVNQSIPRITLKWLIGSIIRSVSRMWYCIWRGLLLSCWLVLSSSPKGLVIRSTVRTIDTARLHLEFSNEGSQDEWLCRPWINWSINKYEVDVSNTCEGSSSAYSWVMQIHVQVVGLRHWDSLWPYVPVYGIWSKYLSPSYRYRSAPFCKWTGWLWWFDNLVPLCQCCIGLLPRSR